MMTLPLMVGVNDYWSQSLVRRLDFREHHPRPDERFP